MWFVVVGFLFGCWFFFKDTRIFNMSKAIVKVMVDPVFISYNTEVIARIFAVTDDRKRSFICS